MAHPTVVMPYRRLLLSPNLDPRRLSLWHQFLFLSGLGVGFQDLRVDILQPVLPHVDSQGKLHLVDLAGSECAKKGGFIYPEDAKNFKH